MRSGSFAMVAECFGVARSTVYRLWNRVVHTRAHGHIISPEFQSHKKNCGRPPMYPSEFVREGIKNIPLRKRRTQRKLAASLGVSKTTVQRWIVDSTFRVHCNSLKPVLTEENKVARLIMALESCDPNDPSKFHDMMDHVHVDEKWFFLSRQRERYLLLPEEKNPKRCVNRISQRSCFCVQLRVLVLTLLQIHGGMENSVFGLLVDGNQPREHLKTDLGEL